MAAAPAKIRVAHFGQLKREGRPIVMATAWDAITAHWLDVAGLDAVLVGDSLGRAALGLEREFQVTMDMMVHHAAAVARGARRAFRIGDMPFMTYKVSPEQALAQAGRLIQEGGMEALKLEGGAEMAPTVERLVTAGLPVLGHVGLLPQSFHAQGGYRMQGRDAESAERLLADAHALEAAGAFAIVLEAMPADVARRVTAEVSVPTIGIGAGPHCDGQVLVTGDLLGMTPGEPPKLARQYARLLDAAREGLEQYAEDVRRHLFPGTENTYE